MGYKVMYKTEKQSKFKKVAEFDGYEKAFEFVGDDVQEKTNLYWNDLKSMKDGFGKVKVFNLGDMKLDADGYSYRIEEY